MCPGVERARDEIREGDPSVLEKDVTVKASLGTFPREQSGGIVGILAAPMDVYVCLLGSTFRMTETQQACSDLEGRRGGGGNQPDLSPEARQVPQGGQKASGC